MTGAYLHLVLNHIPIISLLVGITILVVGILRKNKSVEKVGLFTIMIVGLITIPAYFSGEAAEELVEKLEPNSHRLIHQHEESAELAFLLALLASAFALVTLFVMTRQKYMQHPGLKWSNVALAIVAFLFMAVTASQGGKIRRPELQKTNDHLELRENND